MSLVTIAVLYVMNYAAAERHLILNMQETIRLSILAQSDLVQGSLLFVSTYRLQLESFSGRIVEFFNLINITLKTLSSENNRDN
jgi:hypothetical protein